MRSIASGFRVALGAGLLAAAPGLAEIGWRWENPVPTSDNLRAIWGSSPDEVWAVGSAGMVVHFDGAAWSTSLEAWASFEAVHGSGPSEVWVSGSSVHRFDGTRWSEVPIDPNWNLYGLWVRGPNDVFAVGADVVKAFLRGIVVHWDGVGWTEYSIGSLPPMTAIWGTGSELFAVGGGGVILHFDGEQWEFLADGIGGGFHGVWGTGPTEVFAAGTVNAVLRYDGFDWEPMPGSPAGYVTSLHGTSAADLYATLYDGSIYRFDGAVWSREREADDSTPFGVWASGAGRALAVAGAGAIYERLPSGDWRETSDDSRAWFVHDLWSDGPATGFAVGSDATFLRWDGNRWLELDCLSAPRGDLWAVWGSGPSDVWAAGTNGLLLHYDGISCVAVPIGASFTFFEVWGSGPDDVWVVGEEAWHFDGASWQPVEIGDGETLRGLWGASSQELFAVGDDGVVYRRQAGAWQPMATGTGIDLLSVWGSAADDVWAVGGVDWESGIVLHFDGEAWAPVPLEPPHEPRWKVTGRGPGDVYVAGAFRVVHFDGERWTSVDLPRPLDARALAIVDERETLFAGPNGAIARRLAMFTADFGYGRPCVWTHVVPDADCDLWGLPLASRSAAGR